MSVRITKTKIELPPIGKTVQYRNLVAGDHFLYNGELFMKLNLSESKQITSGPSPSIGTVELQPTTLLQAVDVEITIKG